MMPYIFEFKCVVKKSEINWWIFIQMYKMIFIIYKTPSFTFTNVLITG